MRTPQNPHSALQQGLMALRDGVTMREATKHLSELIPSLASWKPAEFISKYFYIYDTEELFDFHPSQLHPFNEATRRDKNGKYKYHTVVWSWPKKSAKSTIIAAIVDYICLYKPKSVIRLIGNDLKQADSRVGYYLRENIKIGMKKGYGYSEEALELQAIRAKTKIKVSGYTITYPNGSMIEMVPIDPTGEAGGNDDLTVFSELWGWRHKSHQDMWVEMTISPTRFGQAQRWIDTYAGFEGDSPILEKLYKQVVNQENHIKIPHNQECYSHGGIFSTWVTKHHLPYQPKPYYDAERVALTEEQFSRMHENQWITSKNAFISIGWWDDCADTRPPEDGGIPLSNEYEEMVIAIDAGVMSDCFAIVAVARDGRYPAHYHDDTFDGLQAPDYFIRRYARQWTPPKDGMLKFESKDPKEITPASELRRLVETYNVVQVCYDPSQLYHFMSQMSSELQAWFDVFTQMAEREIADKQLYDIIRTKRIAHYGSDQDMRQHLMNARSQVRGDDRRLRIVKKDEKSKNDLAVALSMACKRANDLIAK